MTNALSCFENSRSRRSARSLKGGVSGIKGSRTRSRSIGRPVLGMHRAQKPQNPNKAACRPPEYRKLQQACPLHPPPKVKMMSIPQVQLRQWKDADLAASAEMNADAEVMRYFLAPLSADDSTLPLYRFHQAIGVRGWGFWAVDVDGAFAGFTGFAEPAFAADSTPCVEIDGAFSVSIGDVASRSQPRRKRNATHSRSWGSICWSRSRLRPICGRES